MTSPDLFAWAADHPPYNGEPPSQRHSDTSRAAAASIKGKVRDQHRLILGYLATAGGSTDEQLQRGLKMPANTERPRRCELTEMGLVEDSGLRGLTESGRKAVVWKVVVATRPDDGPTAPTDRF